MIALPGPLKSLMFDAARIVLVAAALFAAGYLTRMHHESDRERKELRAARASDALQVDLVAGVEKRLQQENKESTAAANAVSLAITFIQPIAREQPGAKTPSACEPDPYLSLDAVRLLNVSAAGSATDAQRVLDAARRAAAAP